jgi:preprotein translocase subunit SecG
MVLLLIKLIYFFVCALLILVILVQDPRGGGLAGVFGGPGGASAFGTKAGDIFTKITIALGVAFFIIVILLGKAMVPKSVVERVTSPAATSEELPTAPAEEAPLEETSTPAEAPAD